MGINSKGLVIGAYFISSFVLAQDAIAPNEWASAMAIGFIDAKFAATCEKQVNAMGVEGVSNKEECLNMLAALESSLMKEDGCASQAECTFLINHIRDLKKL